MIDRSTATPTHVYTNYNNAVEIFFDSVKSDVNDVIFVMGDFNFPHIGWIQDPDAITVYLPANDLSGVSENILCTIMSSSLSQ